VDHPWDADRVPDRAERGPVIGKISAPRGKRVEPLIRYLFGPGRHEEHTDPHVVAGFRHPALLEPPLRADGARDLSKLNGLLNQPNDAMGSSAYERPVWHCALRAAPEDKTLSDDEWAQIAHDVMDRTGLARPGDEDDAVRWIAVRHAPDHIHLVVMLARQDGTKPSTWNDRYRVRDACQAAEQRYGLRSTSPADRTAPKYPSRAESEKAGRRGLDEAPRVTLRRAVNLAAASSATAEEFFARLEAAGITVRPRYSTKNPGQVTGYAVALGGDVNKEGMPVWYSGGKLAADLTWPKLALRWHPARQVAEINLTDAERAGLFDQAAKAAANATAHIRAFGATTPGAAADAAQAAADTLHVAAAMLGSRSLPETRRLLRARRPPAVRPHPPPRRATSSAAPPGSWPPTPASAGTAPTRGRSSSSGSPPSPRPWPISGTSSSAPPRLTPPAPPAPPSPPDSSTRSASRHRRSPRRPRPGPATPPPLPPCPSPAPRCPAASRKPKPETRTRPPARPTGRRSPATRPEPVEAA
jgi:hypothetical protein